MRRRLASHHVAHAVRATSRTSSGKSPRHDAEGRYDIIGDRAAHQALANRAQIETIFATTCHSRRGRSGDRQVPRGSSTWGGGSTASAAPRASQGGDCEGRCHPLKVDITEDTEVRHLLGETDVIRYFADTQTGRTAGRSVRTTSTKGLCRARCRTGRLLIVEELDRPGARRCSRCSSMPSSIAAPTSGAGVPRRGGRGLQHRLHGESLHGHRNPAAAQGPAATPALRAFLRSESGAAQPVARGQLRDSTDHEERGSDTQAQSSARPRPRPRSWTSCAVSSFHFGRQER